jgi:hypothetical protein
MFNLNVNVGNMHFPGTGHAKFSFIYFEEFLLKMNTQAYIHLHRNSRPSGKQSCFVFGRSLGDGHLEWGGRGFPQSLQADVTIISKIRPRPLPFISFSIRYSFFILSFDTIQSELLTALLNK